jgi:hypothetical protein
MFNNCHQLRMAVREAACEEGALVACRNWEVTMTDILIRDLPDEVIDALDARARQLGLSRSEYVRRLLRRMASMTP